MPSTTVNRGNISSTILMLVSLTPAATGAGVTAEQTFTVPGLLIGDQVSCMTFTGTYSANIDWPNIRVSAPNALTVAFQNVTAGSLTAPSGQYLIEINRPEFTPLPINAV